MSKVPDNLDRSVMEYLFDMATPMDKWGLPGEENLVNIKFICDNMDEICDKFYLRESPHKCFSVLLNKKYAPNIIKGKFAIETCNSGDFRFYISQKISSNIFGGKIVIPPNINKLCSIKYKKGNGRVIRVVEMDFDIDKNLLTLTEIDPYQYLN